jgi:hypothetical protein
MLVAAIPQRTSMPQNTITQRIIPLFAPLSQAKAGAGATSIKSWSKYQNECQE